jgi:hypothetical protein
MSALMWSKFDGHLSSIKKGNLLKHEVCTDMQTGHITKFTFLADLEVPEIL